HPAKQLIGSGAGEREASQMWRPKPACRPEPPKGVTQTDVKKTSRKSCQLDRRKAVTSFHPFLRAQLGPDPAARRSKAASAGSLSPGKGGCRWPGPAILPGRWAPNTARPPISARRGE